jgi:hypothetical protein
MPNDYVKKEPTKTEKMLYELAVSQNQMERGLWSTSSLVMVLALLTKQKPEEIAELMVNGDLKIKAFSDEINQIVKKLDAKKHPPTHEASVDR